jgi:hypothetical protein
MMNQGKMIKDKGSGDTHENIQDNVASQTLENMLREVKETILPKVLKHLFNSHYNLSLLLILPNYFYPWKVNVHNL